MVRYVLLSLLICLSSSCKQEEEMIVLPAPECQGINMVGKWSIVDSVEMIFLDIDSVDNQVYKRAMTLYENGIGNLHVEFLLDDYFFRWILQCDPNIFTMSIPFNNQDSIFSPSELYSVTPYEILVNELDYKKLKRERTGNINQFNQHRITIRELIKQ